MAQIIASAKHIDYVCLDRSNDKRAGGYVLKRAGGHVLIIVDRRARFWRETDMALGFRTRGQRSWLGDRIARARWPGPRAMSGGPSNGASIASGGVRVADVSIRNLDDRVRERLRVRAAAHGRSMEAEMRAILVDAVHEPGDEEGPLAALVARVRERGGIDLDLPARTEAPRPADFAR